MVSVYRKLKQLQNFDVKRMSILVMVYQHWVCLALHMQGNYFSARIEKHLIKFAPSLFQKRETK